MVLLIVLLIRPQGLFGQGGEKVLVCGAHLRKAIGPTLLLRPPSWWWHPSLGWNSRLLQFTLVAIYVIALLGLNVLTGYNGQISRQGTFIGVGA